MFSRNRSPSSGTALSGLRPNTTRCFIGKT
jgi:hypothetical protein